MLKWSPVYRKRSGMRSPDPGNSAVKHRSRNRQHQEEVRHFSFHEETSGGERRQMPEYSRFLSVPVEVYEEPNVRNEQVDEPDFRHFREKSPIRPSLHAERAYAMAKEGVN